MTPVYNREAIKAWDAYTIQKEPITSIDMMERAAAACTAWILANGYANRSFIIFCGKGNNGGDGLAVARMLTDKGIAVSVYISETGKMGTDDFQTNLQRLHQLPCPVYFLQSPESFPPLKSTDIIIDALVGSGLNKYLDGLMFSLVQYINAAGAIIIAVDVPSGLFLDISSLGNPVVKARHTLTFQTYKSGLLVAENAQFFGEVHVLDIQLHPSFLKDHPSTQYLIDKDLIQTIYKPRNNFAHKGTYGHALIIGGSYGKIGAALLATSSCLKAGAGLVTVYLPKCGYTILQTGASEAMVLTDIDETCITSLPESVDNFKAIGIGPGIGTTDQTQQVVKALIETSKNAFVIDADGLNCLSKQPRLISRLAPNTIITPHPKEFDRLFGASANEFDRIQLAIQKAKELQLVIVLKGHHTLVALPGGLQYFNTTGNAGMATGGSGDVLTGIITSLLAQGYPPEQAALLGVYLHGLAGDCAAEALSMEAMLASDLVSFLPQAFKKLGSYLKEI